MLRLRDCPRRITFGSPALSVVLELLKGGGQHEFSRARTQSSFVPTLAVEEMRLKEGDKGGWVLLMSGGRRSSQGGGD